ncbi:MAG TPA: iron ABC transporter permease [Stellaceae bacterium]|jgi:iron complex transport system permease protein|nr:iron ABC transporter permease [Stellaceae bacterium]
MSSSITKPQPTPNSINSSARRSDAGFAFLLGAALAALVLLALVALAVGAYPVSPSEIASAFGLRSGQLSAAAQTVIWQIRGPRVIGAMLVGAALSSSGAAYQGLFRNPLVSPDILGVAAGAALGAVLGIYLSLPVIGIEALSFVGGLVAVTMVYTVAAGISHRDPILVLVLIGVVIGALLGSGVALLKYLADPENQLPAITFWLLGSLAAFNRADLWVLAPTVVVALAPLTLLRWRLDVMSLGEEEATALGVNVRAVRGAVIIGATLMTAASVSVSGIVGWVGLLVPHLARLIVGPAFARLLPMTLIIGAGFLLLVDTIARTIGVVEMPLGVLTSVLGTPVFIWLLARGRRGTW